MKRDDTSARKLQNEVNYTEVVQSEEFQLLLNTKKKFIVPMSIFFLSFFIALPILTSYSKVLNTSAFGDVTWAWVFAFCTIYYDVVIMYDLQQKKLNPLIKSHKIFCKRCKKGGADFEYNRFCTIFNHRTWYTRHNLFCIEENEKCE